MSVFREKWTDEAFRKGKQAQQAGAPISDNPYGKSSIQSGYWIEGYLMMERWAEKRRRDEKAKKDLR